VRTTESGANGCPDHRSLFVGALAAGLPTVLTAPTQADVGDFDHTSDRVEHEAAYHGT
jgi:hypothetical protein